MTTIHKRSQQYRLMAKSRYVLCLLGIITIFLPLILPTAISPLQIAAEGSASKENAIDETKEREHPKPQAAGYWTQTRNLTETANTSILGHSLYHHLGDSLTMGGDFNGDGYDDFILAAPEIQGPSGSPNAGYIYIFFGRSQWDLNEVDVSTAANVSIYGEAANGRLGFSLSITGDINGDGYTDILVNAPFMDNVIGANKYEGRGYIIWGRASELWTSITGNISQAADVIIYNPGENGRNRLGRHVNVYDLNNDGYADMIYTLEAATLRALVIFGQPTSSWSGLYNISSNYIEILFLAPDHRFGALPNVGDVNGDGYNDLIVCMSNVDGDYRGKVYLIYGQSGNSFLSQNFELSANASFLGEFDGDNLGSETTGNRACFASGVGDVNNDGIDDFILSAPGYDGTGDDAGRAYLVFGRHTGFGINQTINTICNVTFESPAIIDGRNPDSFSRAGDLNQDGFDDFLMTSADQVYIVFGRSTGSWATHYHTCDLQPAFINCEEVDFGLGLAGGGDVNGDTFSDILIASKKREVPGGYIEQGEVFLVCGGQVAPSVTQPADISYNLGSSSHNISWTITDLSVAGQTYTIFKDSLANVGRTNVAWTTGDIITFNVDNLEVGTYNFTIRVLDILGGKTEDTVFVTVFDNAPLIGASADIDYIFGQIGNNITWLFSDNTTINPLLSVRINSLIYKSYNNIPWPSIGSLSVNIDGLAVGQYLFTVILDDGYGATSQDEVTVRVINGAPRVSHPADQTITENDSTAKIRWQIDDTTVTNPTVAILLNNSDYLSEILSNDQSKWTMDLDLSILKPGTYEFTIVVSDGLGAEIRDSVLVTVKTQPNATIPAPVEDKAAILQAQALMTGAILVPIAAVVITILTILARRKLPERTNLAKNDKLK